jgi:hypothetical protein
VGFELWVRIDHWKRIEQWVSIDQWARIDQWAKIHKYVESRRNSVENPPKTRKKTKIKRKMTNFTCDNWVTEYFGRMSEGSATKYVAVVGGDWWKKKKLISDKIWKV